MEFDAAIVEGDKSPLSAAPPRWPSLCRDSPQRTGGLRGHALGILSGDPPSGRDGPFCDDDANAIAIDDGDRGRVAGRKICDGGLPVR
jgi:hypothetical protein